LAASGALRWGPRNRRVRAILLPVGLNLAALALLAAILAAGAEPGGLGAQWQSWLVGAGIAAALGLVGFRFPRSAGLPLAALAVLGVWLVAGALKDFSPLETEASLPAVQPLNDREMVTAFALRVDVVEPPQSLPLLPRALYRWRVGDAAPAEWWWPWAEAQGWARSTGAAMPQHPLKFGVYRLGLSPSAPVWRLEKPELAVPP
jgi:hypothetical protein